MRTMSNAFDVDVVEVRADENVKYTRECMHPSTADVAAERFTAVVVYHTWTPNRLFTHCKIHEK